MRIVMINRYAGAGAGAEKHVVGLCAALRSRGHEVRLLSTIEDSNVERDGAFVELLGTDFWRAAPPLRERAAVAGHAVWNRSAAGAMHALVDRFGPHVVHGHDLYPQLSPAPVVVAAGRGVPVVHTIHNYEVVSASPVDHSGGLVDRSESAPSVRALRTALYLIRRRLHIPRVSAWVAVSRYVADVVAEHGICAQVIPNFVPPSPRPPLAFDQRDGAVFLGRLTAEKGVRDVIELSRLLPDRRITVAGRGPLEEEVLAAARQSDNLTYAGQLADREVGELLARARVVVVPSRWQEPAGLVALEAMAQGTPVVAYSSGGLAEYVSDAGAGEVVAPSAGALATAVNAVDGDRNGWEDLSIRGRRAVATRHSPDGYAERLEHVYRSAAGSDASRR